MHCPILCSEFSIQSFLTEAVLDGLSKIFPPSLLNQYNTYLKTSHLQNEGKMRLGEYQSWQKPPWKARGGFTAPRAVPWLERVHVQLGMCVFPCSHMAQPPCWIVPAFRAPIPQLCLLHVVCLRSSGDPLWGTFLPFKCWDQCIEQKAVPCHFPVISGDFIECWQSPQIHRRIWNSIGVWLSVPEIHNTVQILQLLMLKSHLQKERNCKDVQVSI